MIRNVSGQQERNSYKVQESSSELISRTRLEVQASVKEGKNETRAQTKLSTGSTKLSDKAGFGNFWSQLETNFRNSQNGKASGGLPWREQFKEILSQEKSSGGKWTSANQVWKNCQVRREKVSQHVEAYCGYVEFDNGNKDYKMQVSYTWQKWNGSEMWDIRIVRGNGNNVQYYDQDLRNWRPVSGNWEKNFGGESNTQYNVWIHRIQIPSISWKSSSSR